MNLFAPMQRTTSVAPELPRRSPSLDRAWDAMSRGTHEYFNRFDDECQRQIASARVLNIDGLIKSKTDYREKDLLDKRMLARIRDDLKVD